MNKQKKWILGAGILVLAVALMALAYWRLMPAGQAGQKTIEVQVVFSEQEDKSYVINTQQEMLGQALLDEKLVEGEKGPYGLFITSVDGVKADDSKKQWWRISKDGAELTTGADATPIADGEHYELTLSTY